MTLIGKVSPFAAVTLLLLACSAGGKDEALSPAMQESLRALEHIPISVRDVPAADVTGFDGGTSGSGDETQFGETSTGKSIIQGIGSKGPTGNGPGNGGVGSGTGPGSGGVGSSYGPGGGGSSGVGSSNGAGGGGVASGVIGAGDLASAVCDFLNAFCASISKCSKESDDSCNFAQYECITFVNELVATSQAPVSIPPGAIAGLRCVSNALRSTACLVSADGAKAFEAQVRSCGLPSSFGQDESETGGTDDTPDASAQ